MIDLHSKDVKTVEIILITRAFALTIEIIISIIFFQLFNIFPVLDIPKVQRCNLYSCCRKRQQRAVDMEPKQKK